MKKIGFIISQKENEFRRAIDLKDLNNVKNKTFLFFQKGYGRNLGYSDQDIVKMGCNIMEKEKIIEHCDVICEPKIGDADDLNQIKNKTIFGWIHATQNYDITQTCIDNKLTVYAWEKMFEKGRHIFDKNNQIAGEAAILHAMLKCGQTFEGLKVAILGRGNTAIGAYSILNKLGADIDIYSRNMENVFKSKMNIYDIIVNGVLWDVTRKDHIINKSDLKKLKRSTIIIDISCDRNGAIETSIPTTIENPIYEIDGIVHYVVDHTPSLLHKKATKSISKEVTNFLDDIIEDKYNTILDNSLIIKNGKIIDNEILKFQNR